MLRSVGPGSAVFTGGGWLLGDHDRSALQPETAETLVLSNPYRVLAARTCEEVPKLLEEIGAEQARGRYVAGYLAYEAGAAFGFTVKTSSEESLGGLPLAWMAVYPAESARFVPRSSLHSLSKGVDIARIAGLLAATGPKLSVTQQEFIQAIGRIRELIAAGDTYQVNYTVRARFDLDVDPLDYFLAMIMRQPVPYAAFIDLDNAEGHRAQVLSLSPELFLRRHGRAVESMPMKGTRPRSEDPTTDATLAEELIRSEKDRAENLMIVDMVRNDLGRVSKTGTIQVPALYSVEPYRTVWQMVSTVTGMVRSDAQPAEIIAATFPGASITGAPKYHTMEIIASIETEPRGIYTGAVCLFLPGGDFTCNLAIRTLTHSRGSFRLGVGSGIVWDSDVEAEYEETLTKATFALPRAGGRWQAPSAAERVNTHPIRLFETILMEARDDALIPALATADIETTRSAILARYTYLSAHLDRLAASAAELNIIFNRSAAEDLLFELALTIVGRAAVRLDVAASGELHVAERAAPDPHATPATLIVSPFRTDLNDPLLRHKTTSRYLYDRERKRALTCDCHEALFLNSLGRVTEGAITNIFARFGDVWATPPVTDGLLPGIWRAAFLSDENAIERSFTLEELLNADEIIVGNSVRGPMTVGTIVVNCLEGLT